MSTQQRPQEDARRPDGAGSPPPADPSNDQPLAADALSDAAFAGHSGFDLGRGGRVAARMVFGAMNPPERVEPCGHSDEDHRRQDYRPRAEQFIAELWRGDVRPRPDWASLPGDFGAKRREALRAWFWDFAPEKVKATPAKLAASPLWRRLVAIYRRAHELEYEKAPCQRRLLPLTPDDVPELSRLLTAPGAGGRKAWEPSKRAYVALRAVRTTSSEDRAKALNRARIQPPPPWNEDYRTWPQFLKEKPSTARSWLCRLLKRADLSAPPSPLPKLKFPG